MVCADEEPSLGAAVAMTGANATAAAALTPARRREDPKVLAAIAVTTLLWASAFVAIRSARTHFEPVPLTLGRLLVGAVALSTLMRVQRVALPARRDLPAIIACGVLWFGAYNVALNQGERLVDAGPPRCSSTSPRS